MVWATSPVACGGTSSNYLISYAYDLAGHLIGVRDNGPAVATPAARRPIPQITPTTRNALIGVLWSPATAQTAPAASTSATFGNVYDANNRRIGQSATDKSWWNYPTTAASTPTPPTISINIPVIGLASPTYDGNGNLTFDGTLTFIATDVESRRTSTRALTVLRPSRRSQPTPMTRRGGARRRPSGRRQPTTRRTPITARFSEYNGAGALQAWYAFALGPDAVPEIR